MCGFGYKGRRRGDFFGMDAEGMRSGTRVMVALAVLLPVGLSGVLLVAFAPGLWWVFTTYFWVAFPAVGLLGSGIAGLDRGRAQVRGRVPEETAERRLLRVVRDRSEVTAARAAVEASLAVDEADEILGGLAEGGHLEVRVRGGGIFYSLWEPAAIGAGHGEGGRKDEA